MAKADERALSCPACGRLAFPRIDAAIIVGVLRGERLLLAHNRRFRNNLHSLIAGFVEVGETLEGTVAREVREEVGHRGRHHPLLREPELAFPSTIMLGFVAEHAAGELRPDGDEIAAADWFARGQLPEIPPPGSISRRIIDAFAAGAL